MRDQLTVQYVRECFGYCPETGVLTWRKRPRGHFKTKRACGAFNTRYSGTVAGSLSLGYKKVKITYKGARREYMSHRLAWAIVHGIWPKFEIDHINGNRADNRASNLRDVTSVENRRNMKLRSDSTSGHMGVHWSKERGKWRARIRVNSKNIHIGFYDNLFDAAAARKSAELKYDYHPNHGRSGASSSP